MRFSNYPRTPSLGQDNLFLTDSLDNPGTKTIPANFLASGLLGLLDQDALYKWYDNIQIPVHERRKHYRGKNLGNAVTPLQQARIRQGLFTDMFIGDYWVINEHKYTIADFDYYMGQYSNFVESVGPSNPITIHHLTLIIDWAHASKRMLAADSDIVTKGYWNSEMQAVTIPDIISTTAESDFGSSSIMQLCLTFISALNSVNYRASSINWSLVKGVLPTVSMLYGFSMPNTIECSKNYAETKRLALFTTEGREVHPGSWMRDISVYEDPFFSNGFICLGDILRPSKPSALASYYPIFNIQYG